MNISTSTNNLSLPGCLLLTVLLGGQIAQADTIDQAYESSRTYSGACDADMLYWSDTGITPDCSTTSNRIDKDNFHCESATASLAKIGMFDNKLVQYRDGGSNGEAIGPYRWQFLAAGHVNSPVECQADWGIHGDGRSDYRWPAAGTNVSDPFTAESRSALSWDTSPRNRSYSLFDGNYLNWKTRYAATDTPRNHRDLNLGFPDDNAAACTMVSTAPVVAVNSFNSTQHLNEVYLAMHDMRANVHWPGNLKKYRLQQQRIVDANGTDLIDANTGIMRDGARSYWATDDADGNSVHRGGAAQKIPAPEWRKLYSNIVSGELVVNGNSVTTENSELRPVDLGLGVSTQEPELDELIAWARGADLRNDDGDTNTAMRGAMGDSLNAQAAAIIYGGDDSDPDTVVFVATNDGYVHAISGRSGQELWAFIPRQLLANLARLHFDKGTKHKHYGLDGDLVAVVKDVDGDGNIEATDGDSAYLLFGMGRGGHSYFALDVTDKNSPQVMWTYESYESGESWSKPAIARMNVSGLAQNSDNAVVVIGGGYDSAHDTSSHPAGADGSGAGIHILDLVSGERLWRAGMDAGADLPLNRAGREMDRAIPNQVRVIDLNGDGLADRMYASDLGGQVWRFDVHNGESADELVTGGVIAQLGADGNASIGSADTRRFYNAPDVSLATDARRQERFLAISIGSGYRPQPLDISSSDRFFSLRDPHVFKKLDQQDYDNYPIITVDDLSEVSEDRDAQRASVDRGWMFTLPDNEKVLTESLTFADKVYFVSFVPESSDAADCGTQGTNHLYRRNIVTGSAEPAGSGQSSRPETESQYRQPLQHRGVAPSPIVLFPGPDADCSGDACGVRPLACIGTECFEPDLDATPVRTLWTQDGIE